LSNDSGFAVTITAAAISAGPRVGIRRIAPADAGVAAGKALAPALARRDLVAVFSSPLSRAMRTAELVGLTGVKPDPDLMEWDYTYGPPAA
jgi:probable phosphoglycerate mutase